MSAFDRRLKELLVKHNRLARETADSCLENAIKARVSLTEYLVRENMLKEPDIISTICLERDLTPINLKSIKFDKEIVNLIPQEAAESYGVLIISKIGKYLTLAVSDPFDLVALDDLKKLTESEIIPVVSTDMSIMSSMKKAYKEDEEKMQQFMADIAKSEDGDVTQIETSEEEDVDISAVTDAGSPVVKLVNLLVSNALKRGASDIHIEPYEKRVRIRYRIDGACTEVEPAPPKRMQNAIISRIKIMSELDIAEKRKPQDGKFRIRYEGRDVDFRVSILPIVHGEKCVMRILDSSSLTLSLESLGFEPKALGDFKKAIESPYGMLLVTGPTGSGKSTTLYSAIREVISIEDNIVTVEDPVEYQLEGVNQVPVNPKRGLTFAGALRSILRQDPDTVMIGEIRDRETAEIAIKAALTGHLVLSTLHTNDAPSTITRLVDMGIDPFMVATSLLLCSAQRLGRKLCKHCKQPVKIPAERLKALGCTDQDLETFGIDKICAPKGCGSCTKGYKGRYALLETLPITESVQRIIVAGGSAMDIKEQGLKEGMITLRRVGMLNALKGITSIENVVSITLGD